MGNMQRGLSAVTCALVVFCLASSGWAQETGGEAGLPSLHDVAVATALPQGTACVIQTGYGYTPGVFDGAARHHRILASFAASLRPRPWLGLGLQLASQFDRHVLAAERENNWVGTPRLTVRGVRSLRPAFHLGVEASVWFPGREAPSIVLSATSVDLVAIAGYAPSGARWSLSANLGFRLDRSIETAEIADEISRADRLSLDANAANAVIARVAGRVDMGRPDLIAALSWAPQVGAGAAAIGDSPFLISVGASIPLGSSWEVSARMAVNAGGNYSGDDDEPLGAFEPRVGLLVGVGRLFHGFSGAPVNPVVAEKLDTPEPPAAAPPPHPLPSVSGTVLDSQGSPVPGAAVYLSQGAEERKTETDATGAFSFDRLAEGAVTVIVIAEGFEDEVLQLDSPAGEDRVEVTLRARAVMGEIRGEVLSNAGTPVQATLVIEPVGVKLKTAAGGGFLASIPPGDYTVVVRARGYRTQRRKITVSPSGVTILNISLSLRRER